MLNAVCKEKLLAVEIKKVTEIKKKLVKILFRCQSRVVRIRIDRG